MQTRRFLAMLSLLATGVVPVSAQWQYNFSGTFDQNGTAQTLAFQLTTGAPVTAHQWLTPTTCTLTPSVIAGQVYLCSDQEFDPNGFGTGFSFIGASFQNFDQATMNPTGGGGAFFFFDPWVFTTPGIYNQTSASPIMSANPFYDPNATCSDPNEDACRQFNYYGSAGTATLSVIGPQATDVVPEPGSMTLIATGLIGLATAQRRRSRVGRG